MKLVSLSYLNSDTDQPIIDYNLLKKYKDGLIALSSGLNGEVAYYSSINDYDNALQSAKKINNLFNDNFYLEIQNHGIENQIKALKNIMEFQNMDHLHLIGIF